MTQATLTGQDIAEAQGAVRALLEMALAPTGTSATEFIVLRILSVRGECAPTTLRAFLEGQRQLNLDEAAVVDLLDVLEGKGLIRGWSPHTSGPVRLTSTGATVFAALNEEVASTTARLYENIDDTDLMTAHHVLRAVIARAAELQDQRDRPGEGS